MKAPVNAMRQVEYGSKIGVWMFDIPTTIRTTCMTFLLALANDSYSLVLGDRRLSCDGQTVEDEANKVCVLFCDDARVSIAYTGLATWGTPFGTKEAYDRRAKLLNDCGTQDARFLEE